MSRSKRLIYKKKKKRLLKNRIIFLSSFLFILTFSFLIFTYGNNQKNNNTTSSNPKVVQALSSAKETSTLTLSTAGDIMTHMPQLKAQYYNSSNTYNFDNNFQHVKHILENDDLSIANLETTLAGTSVPYSSYPTFNTPDNIIDSLKYAGIDILSTINNHSFDKGDLGVKRTLDICKEKEIETIGTSNKNENRHIIKEINDISLGIIAFSYGEIINNNKYLNGIKISDGSKDNMNIFDMHDVNKAFNTIKKELDKIRNTDTQIAVLHWGNEYQRTPSKFQKELAQKLCDYGVDIIVGSHPHVVQPVEIIRSKDNYTNTLVIYSLGNFISNQRQELLNTPYTEDGLIVSIELTKDHTKNQTLISSVNCIPTWVNKYKGFNKDVYEIIPIYSKEQLLEINNLPMERLKLSYENTVSQIKTSDIIKVPQNIFEQK